MPPLAYFHGMNAISKKSLGIASLLCSVLTVLAPSLRAQTGSKEGLAVVEGRVCDSQDRPITGVVVSLETAEPGHVILATTDAQGRFRFDAAPAGTYTVSAKREGYQEGREGPFVLHAQEAKSLTLLLANAQAPGGAKDASSTIEFSDEPAFTVAGVTDTTALGGARSRPTF